MYLQVTSRFAPDSITILHKPAMRFAYSVRAGFHGNQHKTRVSKGSSTNQLCDSHTQLVQATPDPMDSRRFPRKPAQTDHVIGIHDSRRILRKSLPVDLRIRAGWFQPNRLNQAIRAGFHGNQNKRSEQGGVARSIRAGRTSGFRIKLTDENRRKKNRRLRSSIWPK